ncbi:hypothetical protein AWB66_00981 [Caballeronia telluris]|uniref:Uncharacterized protein n=1 Tax=Caballeronia telluris TaxID=326475 RepID=A0A158FK07_9BURK|nr:hypothetical protein AWB66_00981 [Caballeronia telluris]
MNSESVETGARRGRGPVAGESAGRMLVAKARRGLWTVFQTRMQARMQRW